MALSWKEVKELQEKKANLKGEAEKVLLRSKGELGAGDQKEYDAILSDLEITQKRIDNATKLLGFSAGDREEKRSVNVEIAETTANSPDAQREEFKRSLLTSSVSGSIVGPTYFADAITKTLSTKVGMIQLGCTVINSPTGTPFYYPTVDDTGNAATLKAEGADRDIATDPTLANKTLNSWTYSSGIIKVSAQMMRDYYIDCEKLIIDLASEKLARKIAYDTILGDGSSKITGALYNISAAVTSAQTFSLATPFTYAEMVSTVFALDAGHRQDSICIAASSAVAAMAGLTWNNSFGGPVWAAGQERRVENLAIKEVQDMATLAAGSYSFAVINPKKYVFRFVGAPRITVLKELYAASGHWGILVEQDCDAKMIDTAAVKALRCKP